MTPSPRDRRSPSPYRSAAPAIFLALALFSAGVSAEERAVRSMGIPSPWKPYVAGMFLRDLDGHQTGSGAQGLVGIYRDLLNPIYGFGVMGEAYYGKAGGRSDGGVRLMTGNQILGLRLGGDYSFRDEELDFVVSLALPFRRGGPLGRGGHLRFDWFPGKENSFTVGISVPFGQPRMGKTRPRSEHVKLPPRNRRKPPYVPDDELRAALADLRHAANWVNRFTTPFFDQDGETDEAHMAAFLGKVQIFKTHIHEEDARHPNGHTFEAEISSYHEALERCFALAARTRFGAESGRIADRAREILLDEVILPYNRLLGERKTRDSVFGLGARAAEEFDAWLRASPDVPAGARAGLMYVFRTLLEFMDENRRSSRNLWGDSRLVWLPLHYALRLDEYATQRELDAFLERAVEEEFTDGNDVHYLVNEVFFPEVARTILAAEDYHVLWIHDFRGSNNAGKPDRIGYRMTVEVYLRALIDAVRGYEERGRIPVYMVFLDQFFYEVNDGRLWLELLEDPLEHEIELPPEFADWSAEIRRTREELRAAVAASPALREGSERYGQRWLRDRIKVHVNITNPSDPSFRSRHLIEYVPFVPDNLLRDHRKIAFYDVTELDPGKGEAIYTGMGVGEHYAGPTWEDRALLARGPALLALKDAARELLLTQGFEPAEIPVPLRPLPKPSDYEQKLEALRERGWDDRALEAHNATGYGRKKANVVKGVLYNLMPKGSHIYVPDSLWNSPHWGGMLVGAALRGCRVYVVSPALENAPSAGLPQMSRANEVFTRFVILQDQMRHEIEAAGGRFRTGIYTRDVDVGDIAAKARAFSEGVAQTDWFREEFPFHPSVYETISRTEELLRSQGFEPEYLAEDVDRRKPKLHFKAQLFASDEAISTLVPLEEWEPLVRRHLVARAQQTGRREQRVAATDLRAALSEDAEPLVERWWNGLSDAQRETAVFYLSIGSHNQDYRGKIMDGEVLVVVPRLEAMIAYLDFVYTMGLTTWVRDIQEVDALLPSHSGIRRWLGRHLRNAL